MRKKPIYRSLSGKQQILDFYSGILENWKKPSEQHFIDTRFGKTFVIESGSGTAHPVILLHGSSSNSAMWMADTMALSENYRVLAIDIIGECGLSNESRPPFSNNNYYLWLTDILNCLKIARVSIIGCSLGGWIATEFAIRVPGRVEKLILMATAGITPVKTKTLLLIMLASIAGHHSFNKINKMVYGDIEIDTKAMEFALLIKGQYIPRNDMLPLFKDSELGRIGSPTLFIGGENDCFYNSRATATRIKTNVKKNEVIVLPSTGHVLIDQTVRIMNFLKSGHE